MFLTDLLQQSYFSKLRWPHICKNCITITILKEVSCLLSLQCQKYHYNNYFSPSIISYLHFIPILTSLQKSLHALTYRLFTFPYTAPSFFSTAPTVFTSIFRSFPKFQFSIYSRSSFTTSSKSVMLLRPLICHIPVMPGFMASLVQCLSSYCSTSETRGGLVPTREMSPLSTLKNCGNSSMLQSRMKLPIPFL